MVKMYKYEQEVRRILHLQNLANQLPDAFIDTKKVTKSHIPAANTPVRIGRRKKECNISILVFSPSQHYNQ